MSGELRAHIQRKWRDGCYFGQPQSLVGDIVGAVEQYMGVAKKLGKTPVGKQADASIKGTCFQGCDRRICSSRGYCVGADQATYTFNELTGLSYSRNKEVAGRARAILQDLSRLGR